MQYSRVLNILFCIEHSYVHIGRVYCKTALVSIKIIILKYTGN